MTFELGERVYDMWTHREAFVVAGAQASGHLTIRYCDGRTVSVKLRDLRPDAWAESYSPLLACDHGKAGVVTFHAIAAADHERQEHTVHLATDAGLAAPLAFPMDAKLVSRADHEAAGWDCRDYPRSIR